MERHQHITEVLEHDNRFSLEYGVPLESVPYWKIREYTDESFDEATAHEWYDAVEQEAREGRYGACAIRKINPTGADTIEIWSYHH